MRTPSLQKMRYFVSPCPSLFWRIRGVLHFGLNFYLADPIYVDDINMTERRNSTDRLPSLQIAHYQGMIANAIEKTARHYKCIIYRHSYSCQKLTNSIAVPLLLKMIGHALDTISSTTPQHPYIWMELHNGIAAALRMQTGELEGTRLSRSVRICM